MLLRKSMLSTAVAAAGVILLSAPVSAQESRSSSQMGQSSASNTRGTGQYTDDKLTSARVKAALYESDTVKGTEVQVDTYNGVVQLSGFVDSRQQTEAAVDAARRTPGVRSVINSLQLKSEAAAASDMGTGSSPGTNSGSMGTGTGATTGRGASSGAGPGGGHSGR